MLVGNDGQTRGSLVDSLASKEVLLRDMGTPIFLLTSMEGNPSHPPPVKEWDRFYVTLHCNIALQKSGSHY